jgi:hypothetical protein
MIETKQMTKTRRVIKTRRIMNILSIVYKIALIIEMINKILKNEIEIIIWAMISFLIDECKDFLILMSENNDCRDFVIFLKFLNMMIEIFSEFLIEMKMKIIARIKMIVWENFSLLMTREIVVSLMLDEMIFLSKVIVLSLIDLEMMILEV